MILPWSYLWHAFEWAIIIGMALVVLRRRLSPAAAWAWLGLTYFLPLLGVTVYLLIGDHRFGRKRVRLHRQVIQSMRSDAWRLGQRLYAKRPQIDPSQLPVILQAERATGMPIVWGNSVELMPDNKTMIRRLVADIDAAQRQVHLLYYIYEADATGRVVADALLRAVRRGVTCRLLADAAGSWGFFQSEMHAALQSAGVQVYSMLPVKPLRRGLSRLDLRNHRKLAIIDGTIAFTGSQNIVNDDYGHTRAGCWVDMSGRFTGPVVAQLQTVFAEDWAFETDEVLDGPETLPTPKITGEIFAQAVPTGPSHESEAFPRVLLSGINTAQKRIIITSPYLVPDEPTMLALAMAADRGVEVSIVLPRSSDHLIVSAAGRSYYLRLLEAGVKIHLHESGLLHAKTITVDDSFALMGSANLDVRSFYLCFEINVLLYGAAITQRVRDQQLCYIAASTPVDLAEWIKRPFYKVYFENAVGLLSPLL
jgi:cardiolipin synthase